MIISNRFVDVFCFCKAFMCLTNNFIHLYTKNIRMESNKQVSHRTPLKRTHRVAFMLNDEEYRALQKYLKKYNVDNASRFMREAVIRFIVKQLSDDAPTLFD